MKTVFIGAGNLATQLSLAMQRAGHTVCQVYSRTEESASMLGKRLGCPYTTVLEKVTDKAELYIAALKDSALEELIPRITAGKPEEALFVHTAGSMPMEVWKGHAKHYGVMYPMQTFSKAREVDFTTIPVFVEANYEDDLEQLKAVGASLSDSVIEADSVQRRFLHLSAVFVCNFANHLCAIGDHLLCEQGVPFKVMFPLIKETVAKITEGGLSPTEAQTGPAVRYDENVMEKHLKLLAQHPEWQNLYKEISKSIHHDQLRLKKD